MLLRGFHERWTLVACILATGAIFIDISVVNVVLPEIHRDLHTSLAQEQWIVNAYLITMTAFVLPPLAASVRMAFSKASRTRMLESFWSSCTISTMRRPA